MNAKKEAIDALGELFIIGFQGLELSESTASFLTQAKIGGVILFSHNFETPAQVRELNSQIQDLRKDQPFYITVDHEGGKVQRFKKGFTRIPDAASIGAMGSPKLAFEIAEVMAKELAAVGINLNYCPIADVSTNPKNPVIGNRAFGSDPELVAKMCTAMVRGHLVHQVIPCVKHFPGHGDTHTDSHFALPKVETPLEVLESREFIPFLKAFKAKCPTVMTAHILCTQLDAELPATLSSYILQDLLREKLRFNKIIISDDLEMKAITDHYGAEDAPRMAIEAGCDLLIYRSEGVARHAYEALVKAIESGKLAPERVMESHERSILLKKEIFTPPVKPVAVSELHRFLATPSHSAIIQKVEEKIQRRSLLT